MALLDTTMESAGSRCRGFMRKLVWKKVCLFSTFEDAVVPPNGVQMWLVLNSFCSVVGELKRGEGPKKSCSLRNLDHRQMQPTIASGSTSGAGATAVEVGGFGTIIGKDGRECKPGCIADPSNEQSLISEQMAREFVARNTCGLITFLMSL